MTDKLTPKDVVNGVTVFLSVVFLGFLAVALGIYVYTGGIPEAPRHAAQSTQQQPEDEWRTVVGNLYIGTMLYDRLNGGYRGEVIDIVEAHIFSNNTIGPGVRVRFPDGVTAWVPRPQMRNLYKTKG